MVNVGHQSNGREDLPSHHISLKEYDDSNETGFICVGEDGETILPDVEVRPYPGQATQFSQGRSKHADKRKPFIDIAIDDFIGGGQMLHHDEDGSRYFEGYMANTALEGRVMNQGLPTYTKGLRDFNEHIPDADDTMTWRKVYSGNNEDTEVSFTTEAAYTADKVRLYMRKVGSPTGNMTLSLRTSGDVDMDTETYNVANLPIHSPYWIEIDLSDDDALSDATTYKLNINYTGGDASNYIEIWYNSTDSKFVYRLLDDTAPFRFRMFEYKEAIYGVQLFDDGSASKLYIYGDRGACDSNSGDKTKLNDATKSWTADEWIGSLVKLYGSSFEEQPWRLVTDNDGTSLTSATWNFAHTTATNYVIIGNRWKLLKTFTKAVQDFKVIGNKVYFAFGAYDVGGGMSRWEEHNLAGVWTQESPGDNDNEGADKILGIVNGGGEGDKLVLATAYKWHLGQDGKSSISELYSPAEGYGFAISGLAPLTHKLIDMQHEYPFGTLYDNVDLTDYSGYLEISVDATFTTGKIAHWKLPSPVDLSALGMCLALTWHLNPANASSYETVGDIRWVIADADGVEHEITSYDLFPDEIYSSTWIIEEGDIYNGLDDNTIDLQAITDIYLKLQVDDGAIVIQLHSPMYITKYLHYADKKWIVPDGVIFNNLIGYAGGAGQTDEKPWFLARDGAYFIEGELLKRVPLDESSELVHPRTGEGACVNGPYLYWNMGERIQRYYAGQLDDIGPDRDYGLPENRRGIPCTMASYPGAVFAGFDAGDSGYSHVMYRRYHGWHELYRAPVAGDRVREVHILGRADQHDQVFVSEGADVLIVPFELNPETSESFTFNWHSHIVTSRIYATTRETAKFFKSLELIQELHEDAAATPLQAMRVYYKTSANSDWTLIGDYLDQDTSHAEEQNIGSSYNVGGNWIQFLIELEAQDTSYSPILVAAVLDATERLVVKNTFTYNLQIREGYDDLLNNAVDDVTGKTKVDQLDTWAKQELPLILSSNSIFEDQKRVFIEPTRSRFTHGGQDGEGLEVRTYQLVLLEV